VCGDMRRQLHPALPAGDGRRHGARTGDAARQRRQCARLIPEQHAGVLVDLDLPGSQALELRRRILGKGCKLVGLIAVSHPSRGYQTVPSGLDGYVSKDISPSDFIEAIRTVLREKDPGARVPGGRRGDGPERPMDVGNDSSPAL
jgi:DNA-binding NarL/FixJ family response regulator